MHEVIEILNESNKIKLPWEVKVHIQYQDEIETFIRVIHYLIMI